MTERGQCCLSWTWARIGGLRRSPRRGTSSTCGGSTRSSFLTGRGISGTLCRVLDLLGDLEGRGQLARLGPVSLKGRSLEECSRHRERGEFPPLVRRHGYCWSSELRASAQFESVQFDLLAWHRGRQATLRGGGGGQRGGVQG